MLLAIHATHAKADRRRAATALLIAAALLHGGPAAAEPAGERPDEEVSRRLSFIEGRLERATPSARLWWSAWYYGYVLVTVGQAGFAVVVKDKGLRTDTAVGGAFATLGVVGLGIAGFPPQHAAAHLRAFPAGTPAERRRKLAQGERLLAASANAEVGGHSWIAHVLGIGVTATGALVQALVYKRAMSSIITFVSGVAITEAQIYTRPTAAIDDWKAYQQGAWVGSTGGVRPAAGAPPSPWSIVTRPGGLGLQATF